MASSSEDFAKGPAGASVTGPTGATSTVTGATGSALTGPTGSDTSGPTGPQGSVAGGIDLCSYRKVGTTNYEAWYSYAGALSYSSTGYSSGTLYAVPFMCPKTITVDYIGIYVAGFAGGGLMRLGIYQDTGSFYPGSRVVASGPLSITAAGAIKASISQQLTGGVLYWLVMLIQNDGNNFGCGAANAPFGIMGTQNILYSSNFNMLTVAQAYGALPSSFPAGATANTSSNPPLICVRLSA